MAIKKKTPAKKTSTPKVKEEYILVVDGSMATINPKDYIENHVLTRAQVIAKLKDDIDGNGGEVDGSVYDLYKVTRVKLTLAKAEPSIKIG